MRANLKLILFSILTIAIDQLSKFFVLKYFGSISTINPYGGFSVAIPGINIALVTLLALAAFVVLLFFVDRKAIRTIAFSLVLAGTLSNLTDRILHSGVVDFINLKIWPTFNLADSAIVIGIGLLILRELRRKEN